MGAGGKAVAQHWFGLFERTFIAAAHISLSGPGKSNLIEGGLGVNP
jgi:hypothetical protein